MKLLCFSCFLQWYKKITVTTFILLLYIAVQAQVAVWDASGMSGFGPSPFVATSLDANLTSAGLTRGNGVTTSGNAAGGGWGGNGWAANAADAVNNDKTVSFNLVPNSGYELSLSALNLHYRRSTTGPTTGMLQYSAGGNGYTSIAVLDFSSTSNSGADIAEVNLQSVAALQHVQGEVLFRIVPFGGNNPAGTWYVFRQSLRIDGSVTPAGEEGGGGDSSGSSCTSITFSNGVNFIGAGISSNYPATAGLDSTELLALAWTCNAIGFPICNQRTFFKLDVSSIPAGTAISSAKLKLFAKTNYPYAIPGQPTYGSNNIGLLQRVTAQWQPDTVTWNSQPPIDELAQKVLPASTSTAQNYEVDITDFVQHWINYPDSNYGMLFRIQDEQHYKSLVFYSTDAATPPSLRPQLSICSDLPLPLHLLNFAGSRFGKTIHLYWDSDNETDMDRFELERSSNGKDFERVAAIKATNKPGINHYSYDDGNTGSGRVYYRLKIVDRDGTYRYSRIISFALPAGNFSFSLSPNPAANGYAQLQINAAVSDAKAMIQITDAAGRMIGKKNAAISRGYNSMLLPGIERLGRGIYVVSIYMQGEMHAAKLLVN